MRAVDLRGNLSDWSNVSYTTVDSLCLMFGLLHPNGSKLNPCKSHGEGSDATSGLKDL